MTGFAGMDEERWGASARQGRGDLAGDMSRFAHAGDHYTALASEYQPTGMIEVGGKLVLQRGDGLPFQVKGASRAGAKGEVVVGIHDKIVAPLAFGLKYLRQGRQDIS